MKIGLFGGSFDPIHVGHLICAQSAVNFASLDRVFFIPTAMPPHKGREVLTDFEIRANMVALAIDGNPYFELSLIESEEHITYTYETVLHFKEKGFGKERIHLIVGSDSLEEIETWRKPDVIFSHATVVAMVRPGYDHLPALPPGAAIIMIETGSNSISSSEIRRMVRERKSIRYLVPHTVERFIEKHSLYLGNT